MKKIRINYIFNFIAVLILFGAVATYSLFENTKDNVVEINKHIYIDYIDNITNNISDMIKDSTHNNIYTALKNNSKLQQSLEKSLQLLVSNSYRYIYVVDKESKDAQEFRFLLDGAKDLDNKSEFEELYSPINLDKWNQAYNEQKTISFQNKETKGVWVTYLKPIIIDGKTEAMIVIDFSLQGHDNIILSLEKLDKVLEYGIVFTFFLFITIIFFAYIDNKRVKEILSFNEKLESKVNEEVEKNRQKDQQIIQQSRLAQMGEMISMIAHQWRQPLAAISSTSSAIGLKAKLNKLDNEMAIEFSAKISNYSAHLSSTIDDFREFFKDNKKKTDITYNDIIENVLSIIEISMQNKDITLKRDLNSTLTFHTYSNELKQVILNLIKNAEDILLEKEIENPTITIETKENILSISDNAGGVPDDIIDKIFDPYFSTKTKKDGTGLGLYMSKTIIEDHCGGELTVKNNKDGAVFSIVLSID